MRLPGTTEIPSCARATSRTGVTLPRRRPRPSPARGGERERERGWRRRAILTADHGFQKCEQKTSHWTSAAFIFSVNRKNTFRASKII
ncbi:unnamed protein product [Caretta caretta]